MIKFTLFLLFLGKAWIHVRSQVLPVKYSAHAERFVILDKNDRQDASVGEFYPFLSLDEVSKDKCTIEPIEKTVELLLENYSYREVNNQIFVGYSNRQEYFGVDRKVKAVSKENSVYVSFPKFKVFPGETKRISFTIHGSPQNELNFGLGSLQGHVPGQNGHREWLISSDGFVKILGVADTHFDPSGDMIWGSIGLESFKFGYDEEALGNFEETIDMFVNLKDQENPFVSFQRFLSNNRFKITASEKVFVTLDEFAKLVGKHESLNYKVKTNKPMVTVANTEIPFEIPKFGPDMPHSPPIEGKLIKIAPMDACSFSKLSKEYNKRYNALHGNVAFVYRGNCDFADKIYNLQKLGASGVIVANNYRGDGNAKMNEMIVMVGGDNSKSKKITIPSVFVSYSSAEFFEAKLKGNQALKVVLTGALTTFKYNGISFRDTGLLPVMWLPPLTNITVSSDAADLVRVSPFEYKLINSELLADKEAARLMKHFKRKNLLPENLQEFSTKEGLFDRKLSGSRCVPMKYIPVAKSELVANLQSTTRGLTKKLFRTMLTCYETPAIHHFSQLSAFSSPLVSEEPLQGKLYSAMILAYLHQNQERTDDSMISEKFEGMSLARLVPWDPKRLNLYSIFNTNDLNVGQRLFESTVGAANSLFNQVATKLYDNLVDIRETTENLPYFQFLRGEPECELRFGLKEQFDLKTKNASSPCSWLFLLEKEQLGIHKKRLFAWRIDLSSFSETDKFYFSISSFISFELSSTSLAFFTSNGPFNKDNNITTADVVLDTIDAKLFVLMNSETLIKIDLTEDFLKERTSTLTQGTVYTESLGFDRFGNWFPSDLRSTSLYTGKDLLLQKSLNPKFKLSGQNSLLSVQFTSEAVEIYSFLQIMLVYIAKCQHIVHNVEICA